MEASLEGVYEICPTDLRDAHGIRGVERCQADFAAEHRKLYQTLYPLVTCEQWFRALCCGGLKEYIRHGVVVLRAVSSESKQVVGYISCTCSVEGEAAGAGGTPGEGVDSDNPLHCTLPEEYKEAHAKINHLVVLPSHRGRGVGRMLFKGLQAHLAVVNPKAALDLRIVAVEQNLRALEWYWRLGFQVVELYLDTFRISSRAHPVAYVKMRRRQDGVACEPWCRFFGEELCGESVEVLCEDAPAFASARAKAGTPRWEQQQDTEPAQILKSVRFFDHNSGMHLLEDGHFHDLTLSFARGRVRFGRPLHMILSRSSPVLEWFSKVKIEVSTSSNPADEAAIVPVADLSAAAASTAKVLSGAPDKRKGAHHKPREAGGVGNGKVPAAKAGGKGNGKVPAAKVKAAARPRVGAKAASHAPLSPLAKAAAKRIQQAAKLKKGIAATAKKAVGRGSGRGSGRFFGIYGGRGRPTAAWVAAFEARQKRRASRARSSGADMAKKKKEA